MSEPIPESIPTSADPRSRRPLKRARPNAHLPPSSNATAAQASLLNNLFLDPEREIKLPDPLATKKSTSSALAPPPEIVANVQGSSAGAGSGEFHVYKASRRREYERLRSMEEDARREKDQEEWEAREKERRERDEEATRKKRDKRLKKKSNKGKKGKAGGAEMDAEESYAVKGDGGVATAGATAGNGVKKGLNLPRRDSDQNEEDEGENGAGQILVAEEAGVVIHDDD